MSEVFGKWWNFFLAKILLERFYGQLACQKRAFAFRLHVKLWFWLVSFIRPSDSSICLFGSQALPSSSSIFFGHASILICVSGERRKTKTNDMLFLSLIFFLFRFQSTDVLAPCPMIISLPQMKTSDANGFIFDAHYKRVLSSMSDWIIHLVMMSKNAWCSYWTPQFWENYPMKLNYPCVLCLVRKVDDIVYEEPLCRVSSTFNTHYVICNNVITTVAFFLLFKNLSEKR